jgi:hypothetical protein
VPWRQCSFTQVVRQREIAPALPLPRCLLARFLSFCFAVIFAGVAPDGKAELVEGEIAASWAWGRQEAVEVSEAASVVVVVWGLAFGGERDDIVHFSVSFVVAPPTGAAQVDEIAEPVTQAVELGDGFSAEDAGTAAEGFVSFVSSARPK